MEIVKKFSWKIDLKVPKMCFTLIVADDIVSVPSPVLLTVRQSRVILIQPLQTLLRLCLHLVGIKHIVIERLSVGLGYLTWNADSQTYTFWRTATPGSQSDGCNYSMKMQNPYPCSLHLPLLIFSRSKYLCFFSKDSNRSLLFQQTLTETWKRRKYQVWGL